MDKEMQDYIRRSITAQVTGVLDTYGEALKGTMLEFDLQAVMRQLSGNAPAAPTGIRAPRPPAQRPQPVQLPPTQADFEEDDDLALDDWDDDDLDDVEARPVPAGFADEVAYQAFLQTQAAHLPTDEYGEALRPDSVVGMQQDAQGNWIETGDMGVELAKVDEAIEDANTIRDEETGEVLVRNDVPEVAQISISLTREDGNALSDAHVETILASPQVRSMARVFGPNYVTREGAGPGQRVVTFTLPDREESKAAGRGLIHGANFMGFGGYLVFPAIGGVTAQLVG